MIDLRGIPFTEDAVRKIETSLINYRRFAGVDFVIERWGSGKHFTVGIEQVEFPTDKVLSQEELIKRGQDIFNDILPEGWEFLVMATVKKR